MVVITRLVGWMVMGVASFWWIWSINLSVMSRGTSKERAREVYVVM